MYDVPRTVFKGGHLTKKLIIAVVLSVVVLFVSDIFLRKYYQKNMPVNQQNSSVQGDSASIPAGQERYLQAQKAKAGASFTRENFANGETIAIESSLSKMEFLPGGEISHWYLKEYTEKNKIELPPGKNVILRQYLKYRKYLKEYYGKSTKFVDLVSSAGSQGAPYYSIASLKTETGVLLYYNDNGLEIKKEIILSKEKKYETLIRYYIKNNSNYQADVSIFKWGPGIAGSIIPREITITSMAKNKPVRIKGQKVKEELKLGSDYSWVGIAQRHFAVAVIPQVSSGQTIIISKENQSVCLEAAIEKIPPGAKIAGELVVYGGPKQEDILKTSSADLSALINYNVVGKAIFYFLKLFYSVFKNYGVAIILLALLLKVILFPLTKISLKSMQNMQKLQPQIKILQQRFKNDPEGLNKETMELYKRLKVNPLGGCLPVLFQLPIFWALFIVLQDAIGLRGAPFVLWIKDLSVMDPLYILPVLMGVTTFIQQKMTATDQQQKTMTYFMTIFLTFIFLSFPAGLVLYWLTTNIVSIFEQRIVVGKPAAQQQPEIVK